MKKRLKIVLFLSIAINIVTVIAGIKLISYKGGIKYLKLVGSNFFNTGKVASVSTVSLDRINEFKNYKSTDKDIVFLGDSITAAGAWNEYFPELNCRNRGIGGDRTQNVLNRIDQIISGNPKKIFLLVGINDLIGGVSTDEIINNYSEILDKISSNNKNTKIYVESILPINKTETEETLSKKNNTVVSITNEDVIKTNIQLKELCNKHNIEFIDTYSWMVNSNKELDKKDTIDGLHLSLNGYIKLSKILETYVNK